MAEEKRFAMATWRIMEALLETDNLEEALSGSLEIIVDELGGEAGAIWLLDGKTDNISPVFHVGPADISGVTVENGTGIEGIVTKTGKPVLLEDASRDPRFEGTAFDDQGLAVRSIICVPLNNLHEVIGCVQIVNKKDGGGFDDGELKLCERMAALAAITIEEKGLAVDQGEKKEVLAVLKNITKEYPSGDGVLQVLKGINLEIFKNEFVVVLGESGCGKSTLMNIVGGIDTMTGGELIVDGKDFSRMTEDELTEYRRRKIGFIFQAYNLMPNLTALENVQLIAELADGSMPPEEAIDKVRLSDRKDNFPSQLSGGQQQRVSIARAIVKRPALILADEPTAALDHATGREVLSVIEDIVRRDGASVLMVTHNSEIAKMANRVIKMRNGKVSSIRVNRNPLHAEELVW
ncbi:MAG: ATP-binding cassette domain-containing protein [Clostridia bacterium]|nr:ATP-binding cassette domain-containing protein [Clostridia bacterium]